MIRLTEFFNQNVSLGKVYSDPRVKAFAPQVSEEEKVNEQDHEVSMAQGSLEAIAKHATELLQKIGEQEKDIPGWIQDHIAKAENYIQQANSQYHEYGIGENYDKTEEAAKTPAERIQNLNNRITKLRADMAKATTPNQKNLIQARLKNALQSLSNIKKDHGIKAPHSEGSLNEVGVNDSNYGRIMRMYDSGGNFTKKKIAVAVLKNPNASKVKVMDALRDMDYEEISAVLDDLHVREITEGKYDNELNKIAGAVEKASSFMNVGAELKKIGVKYDFSTSMIPMYRIKVPGNTIAIVNKKYAAGAEKEVGDIAIGLMEGLVNEVSYNVKADNAYQFINGATAVLGAYLRDAKLESGVKNTLQRVVKDLEGLRKYFFSTKDESINEDFKHIISVDTPTQVVSKPVAAQIEKLAKSGVRSKDIGLKMGFIGNAKLATDEFQKLKNKIYFALHKTESVNEAKKYDIGSGYMGNGLTIWNRAEEQNGDYRIIAHISPDGKLSIRDNQLPADLKKTFQIWADSMKKGNRGPLV